MKTLEIIKDDQKTKETKPQRPASDSERLLITVKIDKDLQWELSKTAIIDEMGEARNLF